MKPSETDKTRDLIVEGMKISAKKMLIRKKQLGQKLVISENGVIKIIEAKDIVIEEN
jgi:hypothetical protein